MRGGRAGDSKHNDSASTLEVLELKGPLLILDFSSGKSFTKLPCLQSSPTSRLDNLSLQEELKRSSHSEYLKQGMIVGR